METFAVWLLLSIAFLVLLVSSFLLWAALRLSKAAVETQAPVQIKQIELLDKVTTMLASKDVLAFQGIQAMSAQQVDSTYDPSDEAAFAREQERYGKDWVSDEADDEALREAFFG